MMKIVFRNKSQKETETQLFGTYKSPIAGMGSAAIVFTDVQVLRYKSNILRQLV